MRKSLICLVLIIFLFSAIQTPTGLAEVKSPTKVNPEAPATMTVANNKLQVSKWAGASTVDVEMPQIKGFSDYEYRVIDTSEGKEVDLILYKMPLTNVFYYPVTVKNAVFYYQPPLTAEEIAQGCYRPPEVIGSYAVYGPYRDNEYGTGKIMHIYRPKVVAADGSWTWGVLGYKDGVLSVTVDIKWLANAKYPVTIDPTFGNSHAGASKTGSSTNYAYGSDFITPSGPTWVNTTTISFYGDGTGNYKPAVWVGEHDGAVKGVGAAQAMGAAAWKTTALVLKLASNTLYTLGVVADGGSASFYYDSASGVHHLDGANNYASPIAFDWDNTGTNKYSIYCTYTSTPIITSKTINLDDTTNLYAMKKYYSLTVVTTDVFGATEIAAVSAKLTGAGGIVSAVKVTGLDTGAPTWTITRGAASLNLATGSCTWTEVGNVGTAVFSIEAQWDYPGEDNLDISASCLDVWGTNSTWSTTNDYVNVIARLTTYQFGSNNTGPSISSPITLSGYVRYCTTAGGLTSSSSYPPDAQFTAVKIYDDEDALQGSNATTITNGAFSVNITSSPVIRTTAYHVWLDLIPDYTDGAAPDGDLVYVTTGSSYYQAPLINQAFAYYGLAVANILAVLSAFVVHFASSATVMMSLIGSIMTAILFVSGSLIYWLALFVNFFIGLFTAIGNILNGTSTIVTGLGDMWAYFGFAAWASAVPVFAFIFWVSSVSSRTAKTGRSNVEIIVGDLQIVTYLVGTIWEWTYTVFNFVVNIIMQFLSVIVP